MHFDSFTVVEGLELIQNQIFKKIRHIEIKIYVSFFIHKANRFENKRLAFFI